MHSIMCQAIQEFYACGCEGACLVQKCPDGSAKCAMNLQNPTPLNLEMPCLVHRLRLSHKAERKEWSTPPSAYHNSRRYPSQRRAPEVAPGAPARHSLRNNPRTRRKSSKSRKSSGSRSSPPESDTDRPSSSVQTGPRPITRVTSLGTREGTHEETRLSEEEKWSTGSPGQNRNNEYAIRAARIRRSLEEARRRGEEEQEDMDRYAAFLEKDHKTTEDYKKKRAQRKAGLRPSRREALSRKTDGICILM